ncbi:bifunctional diguanylate cyclase/phosphodiesterase [Kordiimonas pumila]|uniref:EAL domain-containing protein n=1 Tax=Kordiimonas pumila TaxID=2161677 RepID=A0ABV7D6E1_9PROT|nr:EAL domain-containing protein [Kordiimonas pumila]
MIEQFYRCIAYDHDFSFLAIAALVCFFASFTAISLQQRTRNTHGRDRDKWIILTAITVGGGAWATHFIALVAYDTGMPVSYDIIPTVSSIILAISVSGIGLAIVAYRQQKFYRVIAGAIVGAGIIMMHYLGMSGLHLQGRLEYDTAFVAISTVLGLLLFTVSFLLMHRTRHIGRFVGSALFMTLAICGLHFTGMSGLTVVYDPTVVSSVSSLSQDALVASVAIVIMVILGFSLALTFAGQNMVAHKTYEAARFRKLADAALESIVVMGRNGDIRNANQSFLEIYGKPLQDIAGMNVRDCIPHLQNNDSIADLAVSHVHMEEMQLKTAQGRVIPVELFFRVVEVETGLSNYVLVIRDLSERRAAEKKINHLTNYDILTNLMNRQLFMDRLQHATTLLSDQNTMMAVLYLDIDGFKEMNAIYGTGTGDEILKLVAERLKNETRSLHTVARIGADQFCVMMQNVRRTDAVADMAERLCHAMEQPLMIGEGPLPITLSMGIAIAEGTGQDPESLLARSEVAMRQAKQIDGCSHCFYEDHFDKDIVYKRRLKRDLDKAIDNGEIYLEYQPQYDCQRKLLSGFEALVRWCHPDLGFISPVEFIPLAEESSQIIKLGNWILSEAISEAAKWDVAVTIAVNLSPVQFKQEGLIDVIRETLEVKNLPASRLELEITEGVLIQDSEQALKILKSLRAMGVKLAMDDFGTGYSSLAYLQKFPFDKLKIDRSFIHAMQANDQSLSIIRGMIGLARGLNMPVLAEGVETEIQHAILRSEGCNEVQGYLLGKPKRIEEYGHLLVDVQTYADAT